MQGIVVVNKVVEFRGEAVTAYRDGHAHCCMPPLSGTRAATLDARPFPH